MNIRIAWSPERIDGVWTIDYRDNEDQEHSLVFADEKSAWEEWHRIKDSLKNEN